MSSETIPSGTLLGGRYRVGALLGQGGMGAVYEGMQEGLDRRVALKVLHPHLSGEKELLGRFQREARAVATLGHPNVVQISDFQVNPGEPPFLVMELLHGESLRDLLKRTGPLPPERVAYIFSQVLAALEAAHAKDIVHRDIKPDNIFLSSTSVQADLVKVLDFGVAKVLRDGDKDGKLTHAGFVVGTLSYMAPEQAMGDELDGRADLYSVGACMYLALTGRKPFDAPTTPALLKAILTEKPVPLAAIRQDIDLSLASLVDRALQRDPNLRFANAGEMASALAPFARATPHETSASEVVTQPREAAASPATVGRKPLPTAPTAQIRPGAAAPVEPAFSQRTTEPPETVTEAPVAAAGPNLGPRGPKGTLMSPGRVMPPRPATAPAVVVANPAPTRLEVLAAAFAPTPAPAPAPPSYTPAPHAMESPPMVGSTTAPLAVAAAVTMAEPTPASPAPAAVHASAPPPPSTTQPAAQPAPAWTPPPAAAVPMASVPPFIPHAPAAAPKRGSNAGLLWVAAALIGTITVVGIVVGAVVLRQMMTAETAGPAVASTTSASTSASTSTNETATVGVAPNDSTAETQPLPTLSATASSTAPAVVKPRTTGTTATVAPHTTAANPTLDPFSNRTATPTATTTATTTTTTTATATATASGPGPGGSHSKKPNK